MTAPLRFFFAFFAFFAGGAFFAGAACFAGRLSLANNGGFASARTLLPAGALRGARALVVRARGDGRRYTVFLKTHDGPEAGNYKALLDLPAGDWHEVVLPLAGFSASATVLCN